MIKEIVVTPFTYSIVEIEDLTYEKAGNTDVSSPQAKLHGYLKTKELEILLEKNQKEIVKKATIIHELVHAMFCQTPYYTDDFVEDICVCFEYIFLRLIKDNPELIRYLQEKEV